MGRPGRVKSYCIKPNTQLWVTWGCVLVLTLWLPWPRWTWLKCWIWSTGRHGGQEKDEFHKNWINSIKVPTDPWHTFRIKNNSRTHQEQEPPRMLRNHDKPPDSPPPRLSMEGWMTVGPNMINQIARSPHRSPLLLQSSKSISTPNLTQGRITRLQIADTVRLVSPHSKVWPWFWWYVSEMLVKHRNYLLCIGITFSSIFTSTISSAAPWNASEGAVSTIS